MKRYYYAASTRVAMRTGSNTLNYLMGDHLGSQSITTNSSGTKTGEIRYHPWGTERYTYGTTPTTYHFTGQRLESGIGLHYYGARWYDPAAGRFVQADTIVPGGVQGLDRYVYVNNNPLNFTDPTGHFIRLPNFPFDPCRLGICNEWINNNTPSIIPTTNDPVTLTTVDYKTGVSGLDMYKIYIALNYDLDAYLRIMIMKESGGWWANDEAFPLLKQALVTRFYDWASTNCSNATFNCLMNWWASYSQSAAQAYNEIAPTTYGKEYWLDWYGYYTAKSGNIYKGVRTDEIVSWFYHPPAGLLPPANNGGYDIGILSASLVTNPAQGTQYANQIAFFSSTFYDFGSGLVPAYSGILTYCQNSYWNNNQALLPGCSLSP